MTDLSICSDTGLGLVRVSGRDARHFLHAQTTQRIKDIGAHETRLAAWLNAKGRVRALFDVVPDGDAFWLVLPAGETDYVVQGLGLFVLRADVGLEAATDRAVASLFGPVDQWLAARDLTLERRAVAPMSDAILVRHCTERLDVLAAPKTLADLFAGTAPANRNALELAAVRQGLPAIDAVSRESYIPQMLNLERLDAVSFTKGCYPGQEIVARTQNLGSVKRRLRRFSIGPGTAPERGSEVVTAAGEPAGEINRTAPAGDGFEVLAVVPTEGEGFALASDRRPLKAEPLPGSD